eukprot:3777564-Prymnesium_polylepis.1
MTFLEQLQARPQDALILAGDLCTSPQLLERVFRLLAAKFAAVVYCVGNHELWSPEKGTSSFDKLLHILDLAQAAGVHATPVLFGAVGVGAAAPTPLAVLPLQS